MTKCARIDEAAHVSVEPLYSPYGYVIGPDGMIYTLLRKWLHGVILAILYPKVAKKAGFKRPVSPIDDNDVFAYQRFELDNHYEFPVIRVTFGVITPINVSKGRGPASAEQLTALAKVFKIQGLNGRSTISTDLRQMTVLQCYELLKKAGEY